MSTPRLKGAPLRLVRYLSKSGAGARALRAAALRDYGVDELMKLPPDTRMTLDTEARPIMGAAPRQWEDQQLGTPTPTGHRRAGFQLREAYAAGKQRPSEVLAEVFAAIERPAFGCARHSPFICLDAERAVAAAKASDARWSRGEAQGPLDGLPVPVKDQFDIEGLPTSGGTKYRPQNVDADSHVVTLLREGGALVYGKTHLTEWGMVPTGINPHHLMPRNVYDHDHGAGGSSTGTAVAVALGMSTSGIGTDGGGSIRIPACLNGLFGLKPSFLRISRRGDLFSGSVGHTGPLGQTCSDLVDLLEVTGVPDAEDPRSCYAPPEGSTAADWRAALGRGVKGCRIGIPRGEWDDLDRLSPFGDRVRSVLDALEKAGAELVDINVPLIDQALPIGVLTIAGEAVGNLSDDLVRFGDQMSDDLIINMQILGTVSALEFLQSQRARAVLRRQLARAIAEVDVIAMPMLPQQAPYYGIDEDHLHIATDDDIRGLCRYTFLTNLTGNPAGTAPVGMYEGQPLGIQIVGDAWDEASVLAVMAQIERLGLSDVARPRDYLPLVP